MFRRRRESTGQSTPPVQEDPPTVDGASRVVRVTDETFLAHTEGGYTLVDFWANRCGPCRSFTPLFTAVAAAHAGAVRFGSCDIDANPATVGLLQIRSIPTLVVFGPDGSEIGRSLGAVDRGDLEAMIRQLDARARGAGSPADC